MKIQVRRLNKKLGKHTITINMSSSQQCSSRKMNLCSIKDICYAKKAENLYPNVVKFRNNQHKYWINTSSKKIIEDLKEYLKHKKNVKIIRFNEAGDIIDKNCIKKLIDISKALKEYTIYLYTHRIDLKKYLENTPPNLVINGSNFMIHNNFKLMYKEISKIFK